MAVTPNSKGESMNANGYVEMPVAYKCASCGAVHSRKKLRGKALWEKDNDRLVACISEGCPGWDKIESEKGE